jgi:hypothetical protein
MHSTTCALTHELLELIKQVALGELDFNDDTTAKLDPLEAAVEKAFNDKTRVFQNMHQLAHFLQRRALGFLSRY